jgi:MoaA/NifB/PqqE/SkfB family radical SAM enzyme
MPADARRPTSAPQGVLGIPAHVWSAGEPLGWRLMQLEVQGADAVRTRFVHGPSGEAFGAVVSARSDSTPSFLRLPRAQVSYSGTLSHDDPSHAWKRNVLELLVRAVDGLLAGAGAVPFQAAIGGGRCRERTFRPRDVLDLLARHWAVGDEVFAGLNLAGARAMSTEAASPIEISLERADGQEVASVVVVRRSEATGARRGGAHLVIAERAGRSCDATDALETLIGFALALGDSSEVEWHFPTGDEPVGTSSDAFCVLPWTMLDVKRQGQVQPCDLFKRPLLSDDGQPLDARRHSLATAWNSADLRRVREAHAAGERIDECERCWRVEATGGKSRRLSYLRELAHLVPIARSGQARLTFLSVFPGNLCNLRCRTCGPEASSALIRETQDLEGRVAQRGGKPLRMLPTVPENWLRDSALFRESLDELAPGLALLEFLGGEPLLFDEHFDLLARLVDGGHAGHVELRYVTNGTRLPPRAARLWPHFKRVGLQVSLDGVGARFEYLRHPARWDAVDRNIEEFRALAERVDVTTNATFSLLNAYYLPELFAWARGRGLRCTLNSLGDPRWLDTRALPPAAKQVVRERLARGKSGADESEQPNVDALLDLMDSADWSAEELPSFRLRTRLQDEYRGESFETTFPELAALVGP